MTATFEALLAGAVDAAMASGALPAGERPACLIEEPEGPVFGDATCRVAMGIARRAGRPAIDVARTIVEHVVDPCGWLELAEAAGPGFINLRGSLGFWRSRLAARLSGGPGARFAGRAVVLRPPAQAGGGGARVALHADLLERLLGAAGLDVARIEGGLEALTGVRDAGSTARAVVVHDMGEPAVARRAKEAFGAAGGEPGRVTAVAVAPILARRRGAVLGADEAARVAASPAGRFAIASTPAEAPAHLDAERLGAERIDDPYFAVRYALARVARSGAAEKAVPEGAAAVGERDRECLRGVGIHADVVGRAARRLAPHEVALHGRTLAAAFHRHYNRVGAAGERTPSALAAGVAGVLEDVLALVGARGS